MKKMFCAILTLALLCSLSIGASATVVGAGSSDVGTVSVAVTGLGGGTETVYYVVMDWDSLTFTYNFGGTRSIWKPETHTFATSGGGAVGWVNDSANITLTNHSNADLDVAMAFDGGGTGKTVNGVTASITNHSFTLDTGVGKTFAEADKDTATVGVSGTPSVRSGFDIGKIVVTIS